MLPRLPEEIDTLIVARQADNIHLEEFTVRRHHVQEALETLKYLQQDVPGFPYANIIIDNERLNQLPENGSILSRLQRIDDFGDNVPETEDLQAEEDFQCLFESYVFTRVDPNSELQAIQTCVRLRNATELNRSVAIQEDSEFFGVDASHTCFQIQWVICQVHILILIKNGSKRGIGPAI